MAAIHAYVEGPAFRINQNLRDHGLDEYGDILNALIKSPAMPTVPEGTILYRGVKVPPPLGGKVLLSGLVSSSLDILRLHLEEDYVILVILPAADTKGLPHDDYAEQEFILPHNIYAEVTPGYEEPYIHDPARYTSYPITDDNIVTIMGRSFPIYTVRLLMVDDDQEQAGIGPSL